MPRLLACLAAARAAGKRFIMFRVKPSRFGLGLVLGTALALAAGARATPLLDQVVQARDLICELQPIGEPRRAQRSALMLFIENVTTNAQGARMVSSNTVGARPVLVYSGDTGVHFVEDVSASVKVTSLLSCEAWKNAGKGRKCMRYEAVSAWHFDTSVHRDPDKAFLRLGATSYRGRCEPWHVD